MNLFDKSLEYDEMLNKGIAISGENKQFFIRGRLNDLFNQLPSDIKINRILDFGCGIGDSSEVFLNHVPDALITGTDTSLEAILYAQKHNNHSNRASYLELRNFNAFNEFDLCYVNGVFHHIPLDERAKAIKIIYDALKPGGIFALFENNPLNPGTKLIMSRIPFDRDAITLYPLETKNLLYQNGFRPPATTRFLFYFPKSLSLFRSFEKYLVTVPLGAQYYVMVRK
ncbi:MAG: class I SAM-dependent methyltransferase [Saprospiraceae bacterium]